MLTPLRLHESPIDSHDSLALEPFQRFRKRQETRPSFLVETDFAEVCSALRRSHRHDAIVFQERLKMPVSFRFLLQGIDLGVSALVDDHAEPDGLYLEQFHCVFL